MKKRLEMFLGIIFMGIGVGVPVFMKISLWADALFFALVIVGAYFIRNVLVHSSE